MLISDRDIFTKLYTNYKIMKLSEVDFSIEKEDSSANAFNKITELYELW